MFNTLAAITSKQAGFRSLGDAWADTTTSHGRLRTSGSGREAYGQHPTGTVQRLRQSDLSNTLQPSHCPGERREIAGYFASEHDGASRATSSSARRRFSSR